MFRQTAAYSYQPPDRPGFRCHRRLSTILTMRMMMRRIVMKMMVICIFLLRILSLPSPLCLNYNFFIFMDFSDPGVGHTIQNIKGIQSPSHPLTNSPPSISWKYSIGNMLAWMTSELLKAEQAGEKVHILSHVPAGALLPISYSHVFRLYCQCYPFPPCISPLIFVRYIVWFNHCSHPKTGEKKNHPKTCS